MNKQRDHHVEVVKKEWKRQQHRKNLIKSTTLEIASQYDPAALTTNYDLDAGMYSV